MALKKDLPILAKGTPVDHRLFGKGKVLTRTKLLPDWMTLVRFRSDDGRMAIMTDCLVR